MLATVNFDTLNLVNKHSLKRTQQRLTFLQPKAGSLRPHGVMPSWRRQMLLPIPSPGARRASGSGRRDRSRAMPRASGPAEPLLKFRYD
jgi:hypothetical protein